MKSENFLVAGVLCVLAAAIAYMSGDRQVGFWRGWWIGTRWAYIVGASVFLILAALRLAQ